MPGPTVIPWKRFWCPLGQPINCGETGRDFLADPESDLGRAWSPNTFELEQILDRPCLILVGEPGMGKTTAVEQGSGTITSRPGADTHPLWLMFRDIPNEQVFHRRTFETTKWQTWLTSNENLTLIIDGIDEGLIRVPNFIPYLVSELRGAPLARLKIILICRTAEWSLAEGYQLAALWSDKSSGVFELCPLRHQDARLAAQLSGVDADKFMSAVYEQHVMGLAARPTTLFFLLKEFAAHAQFPGTHFDLYRDGCRRLCEEYDSTRVAALRFQPSESHQFSTAEIHEMAGRIAALLILGGKAAIYVGKREDTQPADLLLEDVSPDYRNNLMAQATSCTGLFSARGPQRLGFAHQTFAECLAAQAAQDLPLAQVRTLFCQRDGATDHVVPQLAETAAWLAAARPDILSFIIRIEPEVLLRSDVSRVQSQHKQELVVALLDRVKQEVAFDDRDLSRFYSGLRHPGLAKQLLGYITDKSGNTVVRRMAIEIAGDCKLEELMTDFLALLRTESNSTIRARLARSLEELTPPQRASELIPLAKGEVGPDADDTIRGCALRVLVPAVWSVSNALPFLKAPNATIYGAYRFALSHDLPKHIKTTDLKPLLKKIGEWDNCFDSLHPFHAIANRTAVEALRNLGDPEIAELVVAVWREKSRQFLHFADRTDSELHKFLQNDQTTRLAFLEAILNSAGTVLDDLIHLTTPDCNMLVEQDLPILLNRISSTPKERRSAWALAVSILASPERPNALRSCWDLLLEKIEAVPELNDRYAWLRAYRLDEPQALQWKKQWEEDKQRREAWERQKREAPSPEALIEQDLRGIEAGHASLWVALSEDLTLKPGDTHCSSFEHDVTETPGWHRSDDQRRNKIVEAARQFLLKCEDSSANEGRTNYAEAGYLAIWLLRDRLRTEAELRTAVGTKWIYSITGRFNNAEENHQELVRLAYELNPDLCIQGLLREIFDDDARHGHILALRSYKVCWDSRLTKEMVELIGSGRLKPTGVESVLSFLAEVDTQAAIGCVRRLLPSGIEKDNTQRDRTLGVLCVGFSKLTYATWDIFWPLLSGNKDFARHVLQQVSYGIDYSRNTLLSQPMSERQLADIYLLLTSALPPEEDPPFTSGTQTARQMVPQLRSDLISTLTARGTDDACRELLRLSDALPNQRSWLRWRHWEASRLKRRRVWHPWSIEQIRSVLDNPAARVIEDEDDLIDVVIESLERFQSQLARSSLPQAALLWNYEGSGNQRKNFSPKDEEDLSDMIATWLTNDIGPKAGVVIGRELQPRRGQKTDITVVAVTKGAKPDRPLTVVIEVKGCWHREVKTAIQTQLVEDYLNKNGWTHGLYVVGWYICDRWNSSAKSAMCYLDSKTFEDAAKELEQLAKPYRGEDGRAMVKAICLDCRFPA